MIKLYYDWAPAITEATGKDKEFKREVKELVDKILPLIEGMVK